ncbi:MULTISPECIES: DNA-processing protein DprA [Duncaniella]|uniref:DNA-processing protein DprA n=1 Tax=Duncaniella TaxID=2518495 RepID=UPI0010A42BAA|nr:MULTISPECIES: DNA-processing protein DprA [Duncaniella]QCD38859.1 DNA-protecting protein DprA [Duncaniella sp. C9]QCP72549.1 DNA-protecting protein DprA [Duncaniella sp. B8]
MEPLVSQIAFSSLRSLSPELADAILDRTGSEEAFFRLSESQLSAVMGFANRLFSQKVRDEALEKARSEADFVESNSIRAIYFRNPDYPHRLLQCDDAPLMLYMLGDCDLNSRRVVSIVGTRHATAYGCDFTERFVRELSDIMAEKPVIVSGLAYGIDIAAHRAALKAGLPTIAVVAHGLNTVYPPAHRPTAVEMIRSGGGMLTDYPSSASIHKGNFLARNRIVAGLADALVVAESASKGGALVTARLAAGYNRDVFALPGRTSDRYSAGCNALIADHVAGLVSSAADFASQMRWPTAETVPIQPSLFQELAPEEQAVIDLLTDRGEATLNDLTAHIDIPTPRLMAMLIDLEFRSLILAIPGGRYRLR